MLPERLQARARLALVFRGASTRWALPASAVLEVGAAPEGAAALRHGLPVEDFGKLLGEAPCTGPQKVTLVLDCAPPRALCVEAVEEVTDLAAAPFFRLPEGLGPGGLIRGALLHRGRLALELEPQALADHQPGSAPAPRSLLPPEESPARPPERSLVFEAGELGLIGMPLSLVTGVIRAESPCRVPFAAFGHRGLVHHERSILSVFDLALMAGRAQTKADLAVSLDVSGQALAVLTSRVVGMVAGFAGPSLAEPGGLRWHTPDGRTALFPEVEAWVFPRT
ncbi:MAG: hypothetical protein HY901_10285 [Deltaproteobacteria bacterium]|nr:hypothetical protein [Deltaproteobacteria bacterium]